MYHTLVMEFFLKHIWSQHQTLDFLPFFPFSMPFLFLPPPSFSWVSEEGVTPVEYFTKCFLCKQVCLVHLCNVVQDFYIHKEDKH